MCGTVDNVMLCTTCTCTCTYCIWVKVFQLAGVKIHAMVVGTGLSIATESTEEVDARSPLDWRRLLWVCLFHDVHCTMNKAEVDNTSVLFHIGTSYNWTAIQYGGSLAAQFQDWTARVVVHCCWEGIESRESFSVPPHPDHRGWNPTRKLGGEERGGHR